MVRQTAHSQRPAGTQTVLTLGGTWRGIHRLFPIAIFLIPFGIAFGVAATEHGMSVYQSIAMSALVFSGAAQFVSLDFLRAPVAFGSLALIMLAINARFIIMGAALSPWVNALPITKRMLVLSYLTNPNFADSQRAFKSGERDVGILLGGGLVLWANWVIGTTLGAVAGSMIGNPKTFGLDVVMDCFLATVLMGEMDNRTAIIPAIVASVIALLTGGWLPTGWNVILAAIIGGIAGEMFRAK
ncbi:branched-chain amino acid ABC transporter permease [Mesorhizobium tianshanense]|uniref:4-azaleucine resistance transporter AzlC n=1 Tax=Mesorhizobium tianshanense TaxID=39844 RepID=A0A562NC62_9HYPH|nr:4-azaleucine resistance transporter AzlC [Mesorhizobium tianshanense]GLS34877.1 branched-chain amino acid ABC transporter permease [Mesorhizobium tianshanense]